ncbi:MAG: quinone-dependent dihydroorotate dehydrogenase [Phycisphaerales bacterium]|nr:quinone-dependent dihydroorotate dehydrogenase [Phycisphaerales bacterium]
MPKLVYPFLRSILFTLPPEEAHKVAMTAMEFVCSTGLIKPLLQRPEWESVHFGIHFPNPIGLAAGFDKNANYLQSLTALGFGFIEIGTVTPRPQIGNPKPRLFRLVDDYALINRMGFNNDGVVSVATRLKNFRHKNNFRQVPIGGNIGKNFDTDNVVAYKDYLFCFNELFDCVDYFVVNISSPNTKSLRDLQERTILKKLLEHLQNANMAKAHAKPILLKIAPDLETPQIEDIVSVVLETKLQGLIIHNTSISRDNLQTSATRIKKIGAGGLSGKPLKNRSIELIKIVHHLTNGKLTLIANGGIFNQQDVLERLNAGAQLVQVWTGFIYEGTNIVKKIMNNSNFMR